MFFRNLLKLSVLLLLIFSNSVKSDNLFSQIFVFGDSLSDTGNLASLLEGNSLPPPYDMKRVSNGPVSVETLALELGLTIDASLHLIGGPIAGTNFAVAGANASGNQLIDLRSQVIAFQFSHGFVAPSDALYVVFIGGNDIRSARGTTSDAEAELII